MCVCVSRLTFFRTRETRLRYDISYKHRFAECRAILTSILKVKGATSLSITQIEFGLEMHDIAKPILQSKEFKSKTILVFVTVDRLGISSPTSRDKLLAAVHELKLFGGPVPDERQFRLNVPGNGNKGFPNPRTKRRSLPTRPSNMQLQNGNTLNLHDLYYSNKKVSFLKKTKSCVVEEGKHEKLVSNVLTGAHE